MTIQPDAVLVPHNVSRVDAVKALYLHAQQYQGTDGGRPADRSDIGYALQHSAIFPRLKKLGNTLLGLGLSRLYDNGSIEAADYDAANGGPGTAQQVLDQLEQETNRVIQESFARRYDPTTGQLDISGMDPAEVLMRLQVEAAITILQVYQDAVEQPGAQGPIDMDRLPTTITLREAKRILAHPYGVPTWLRHVPLGRLDLSMEAEHVRLSDYEQLYPGCAMRALGPILVRLSRQENTAGPDDDAWLLDTSADSDAWLTSDCEPFPSGYPANKDRPAPELGVKAMIDVLRSGASVVYEFLDIPDDAPNAAQIKHDTRESERTYAWLNTPVYPDDGFPKDYELLDEPEPRAVLPPDYAYVDTDR